VAEGRLRARVGLVLSDNVEAPVLEVASAFGVESLFLDPGRPRARLTAACEARYVETLRKRGVEWIALAGFMRILGASFLRAFPGRIVNIHPSLLPAFPGLDAAGQAFDYGVKVAGCTVHLVDAGVDSGPIVLQSAVPVEDADTADTLRARILEQEHRIYPRALARLLSGRVRIDGRRVLGVGE